MWSLYYCSSVEGFSKDMRSQDLERQRERERARERPCVRPGVTVSCPAAETDKEAAGGLLAMVTFITPLFIHVITINWLSLDACPFAPHQVKREQRTVSSSR